MYEEIPACNTYQWKSTYASHLGRWVGCDAVRGWVTSRGKRVECCSIAVYCRMLSHMCGNWYMARFLFEEGSFTLINMPSLMFLGVSWASLCMMLKKSGYIGWHICILHSTLKTLKSSSKVSIMNRYMVLHGLPYQSPHCQPVHGRVWGEGP